MSGAREHKLVMNDCWNRIGVWSPERASCPELERFVHCRNCSHYSAAGRRMLERELPEDYRSEWTSRFNQPRVGDTRLRHSALLFRLGDEWLGLDSGHVREITRMRTIHSVPHRENQVVKGLVNIRGELRVCVSIGSVLQLEKARAAHDSDHEILERMILVEKGDDSFVFPVSEVHGTWHYAERAISALPATLANARHNFTRGIVCWEDRHVGILDSELLFYALARGMQ